MSKIKLIISIVFLIILFMVGFWYFSQPSKNENTTQESKSFLSFWGDFNPFSSNQKKQSPSNEDATIIGEDTGEGLTAEERASRFSQVSSDPVSGYTVFQKERYIDLAKEGVNSDSLEGELENLDILDSQINTETEVSAPNTEFVPALRYVDKKTGNIMQTFADEINERKYTSTVVKGVREVFFGDNANALIMRYLKNDGKTIATYVGTLPKETLGQDQLTANDLLGTFLQDNIIEAVYSADGSKMFYLAPYKDGSLGIVAYPDSSRKSQIFESAFTEWLIAWPTKDLITLTTKPSSNVDGFMYTLNPNTKTMNKVLGKIKGLTTNMSPDGKYVLYSDGQMNLYTYDTSKKVSAKLSVKTLAEKCVWGQDSETIYCGVPKYIDIGEYPDIWYQGIKSFDDDVWRIDAVSGAGTLVLSPGSYLQGASLDIINPKLDEKMKYFFFMDKKTDILYKYKIYQ